MGNNVSILAYGDSRRCPFCEETQAKASLQEQQFTYGEGVDAVPLSAIIPVWHCAACDEQFTDEDAERARHDAVCTHLGRLSPAALRQIRERHGYSQEDWAELTGIGSASIKRWETGNQIQNASLDLLIRLLRHPNVHRLAVLESGRAQSHPAPVFRSTFSEDTRREAEAFQLRPRQVM